MKFLLILTLTCCCSFSLISSLKQRIAVVNSYNPGPCNKKTHGKVVLVKNAVNEDETVICAENKGVFQWRYTDSTKKTFGKFFNPGYDCSNILNKRPDAKDGLFWLKIGSSKPKLAWCDMTTDGGGWILIGRKNNSITWSVPSNDKPVEPYGDPHWSSSLGNAPVLDFRVQVATSENFKATKAHWSFRLQSKRPLKNLMMTTAGCNQRSAGIGNIAYVKDLQTGRVVTTKLRCSKFGIAYPSSSSYGWPQMNSCLAKPCPLGFAFHSKVVHFKLQLDNNGAFSYSTRERISGIENKATAFVGCDNNHCCGCYGPVGGTKDYCAENCQAINGGTVSKHVFTWFWVRSSLPKFVWKKCMDYKVTTNNGKSSWFKFVGGSAVPIQGRCSLKEARFYDGIVVVPDRAAAQKVPPISGLLQYRKDNNKLYVRSNKSWNVIGGEEKKITKKMATYVVKLEKKIAELKSEFGNLNKSVSDLKRIASEKSCATLYKAGQRSDGVYSINPDSFGYFQVWCDMQTDGGGWTVFQRRQDASVNFYRGWQDYKDGFGDLNGNFWLGLKKIHRLTNSGQNNLRIDLINFNNDKAYAKYGTFSVASESEFFKLKVGGFSGNAGDSLKYHNGMKFSTKDKINDPNRINCAVNYKGAWWYKKCHNSNLNGLYLKTDQRLNTGIEWYHWKKNHKPMKKSEMKIRPVKF